MKKKIIRKLILACVGAGCLAITLATTTYAWYSMNNAAETDGFTFNASAGSGFLISVDGINYKHTLSKTDMIKGLIIGTSPENYMLNEDGNVVYKFDNSITEEKDLLKLYQNVIQLYPVTSFDGVTMENLKRVEVKTAAKNSKYAVLDLYFKTTTDDKNDNLKYDIYLDGKDYDDGYEQASRTRIWSNKATKIDLNASMTTYYYNDNNNNYELRNFHEGDSIYAYTSNTFRFSVNDLGYVKTDDNGNETYDKENTNVPLIYEISDDKKYDLGSYATNYSGDDFELKRKYTADNNGMFTYHNNERTQSPLEALDYDDELVQHLIKNNVQTLTDDKICVSIRSGEISKAQIKFWIDGWDGDCFDAISGHLDDEGKEVEVNPINIQLLFNSKKVD